MQVQNGEIFNIEEFSHKLRIMRKEQGKILKDFAGLIGVPIQTYQHYEGGKRRPNIEFIIMLSRATGKSTDYWLGLDDGNGGEMKSPNSITVIQNAKAIIDCAEDLKNTLGEKISNLKNELRKAEK